MNKYLGPTSRFGDGDGSFWDRWLTTTGHFSEEGNYSNAGMPIRSMYSKGSVRGHQFFCFGILLRSDACVTCYIYSNVFLREKSKR